MYNELKMWYPTIRSGTFVWSPPPAAADVCLEELRKARMKRKNSLHIVCVQRLMTPLWMKQLNKAADCFFVVPARHPFWDSDKYEPLIVAVLFPYIPHRPFQLKSTPKMFYMGRTLCKVFKEDHMDGGDLLCKFLLEIRGLQTLSQELVWKMLYFGNQPPFECEEEKCRRREIKNSKGRKRKIGEFKEMGRKNTKPKRL